MTDLRKEEGLEQTIAVHEYFLYVYWNPQIISQGDISSSARKEKSLVISFLKHFKKMFEMVMTFNWVSQKLVLGLGQNNTLALPSTQLLFIVLQSMAILSQALHIQSEGKPYSQYTYRESLKGSLKSYENYYLVNTTTLKDDPIYS